jgi:hypothetical protein
MALALAATAALLLSLAALARPVLAASVDPILVQGNKSCGELGAFDHEFKIEPVASGTYDDPNSDFSVEITVNNTADGPTVDFDANLAVDAVFVKGGPGGNLYVYDPAVTSDTGLHAPGNDQGIAVNTPPWSGLSHISFCFNEVPTATPTPTPTPTATPTQSVQATPSASVSTSPEESVQAATGTPAASTPNTAFGLDESGNPGMTILFAMILLTGLAGLAYANFKTARQRS